MKVKKKNHKHKQQEYINLTPKAMAVMEAIKAGVIPEIIVDGINGYDTTKFDEFWTHFTNELMVMSGLKNSDNFWEDIIENSFSNKT